MSMLTVIAMKIFYRTAPVHFSLRLGLSVLAGYIIASTAESNAGVLSIVLSWVLLLGLPALLTWSRSGQSAHKEKYQPKED